MNTTEDVDRTVCLAAIRGQAVPSDLQSALARSSLVRGIRCHYKFATDNQVNELCFHYSDIARARNARLIMSNEIPDGMDDPALQPYCMWYPDFATEDTYSKLVARYPSMRYHVGRACAAAGYANLYQELDLLPDVSIAEEARESKTEGGDTIFQMIMATRFRYAVMHDADRSVNIDNPTMPAYLNGDTAVRWTLTMRQPLPAKASEFDFLITDIEEDRRLDDGDADSADGAHDLEYLSVEESRLLYSPLPRDLPTIRKEILIQMAAYEGNIDRYARLKRSYYMSELELLSVIRGIFHHTMFARWWADEVKANRHRMRVSGRRADAVVSDICEAINARRLMINEISSFNEHTEHLPFLIWWPLHPLEHTLRQLVQRCPKMKHQIAIACIKCDYQGLYTSLQPKPHRHLRQAAEQSSNPFYLQDLNHRAAELGLSMVSYNSPELDGEAGAIDEDMEPTGDVCAQPIAPHMMRNPRECEGPYFGDRAAPSIVERYVWQSEELLRKFECMYGRDSWNGDLEPTVADDGEADKGDGS